MSTTAALLPATTLGPDTTSSTVGRGGEDGAYGAVTSLSHSKWTLRLAHFVSNSRPNGTNARRAAD